MKAEGQCNCSSHEVRVEVEFGLHITVLQGNSSTFLGYCIEKKQLRS